MIIENTAMIFMSAYKYNFISFLQHLTSILTIESRIYLIFFQSFEVLILDEGVLALARLYRRDVFVF
jgi:hypothetical protein